MKTGIPRGIYYLLYSHSGFKCHTKCITVLTKKEYLDKIKEKNIPEDYRGYFEECETIGKLAEGTIREITEWVEKHMPDKFGDPLL